jgi:hypothetical protein
MLGDLGTQTITDFKALLKNQQESDTADSRRIEEEGRTKAEAAKFEAEHEEKVRRRE